MLMYYIRYFLANKNLINYVNNLMNESHISLLYADYKGHAIVDPMHANYSCFYSRYT